MAVHPYSPNGAESTSITENSLFSENKLCKQEYPHFACDKIHLGLSIAKPFGHNQAPLKHGERP